MKWLLFVALLLAGCQTVSKPTTRHTSQPAKFARALVISHSIEWSAPLWEQEALRRFDHPLVVVGQ